MSSVEQALVLGPYFVVNLFLAVLKTKFGKAQSLFQSKIVKHGKKRNILAAASGFLAAAMGQGLTLVHFSAQPEPFLTQNTP